MLDLAGSRRSLLLFYIVYLLPFWLSVVLDLARSHRFICYVWCARPSKVPQTNFYCLLCILQLLYLLVVFSCGGRGNNLLLNMLVNMICSARSGKIPQIISIFSSLYMLFDIVIIYYTVLSCVCCARSG